ncbi:MAG: hypothetical protein ACLFSM_02855 [Thermoplasmata archaeon]
MNLTPGVPDFKEEIWEDWESVMDIAVYISETISEHIAEPEIMSGLTDLPSMEDLEIPSPFDNSIDEKGFLQEEREELRESFESEEKPEKNHIKSILMSIWDKVLSRSKTFSVLENIGRRIYERLIQKLLPFNFTDDKTPIISGEEKKKSVETKIVEHFEEKVKESMRENMRKRMQKRIQ